MIFQRISTNLKSSDPGLGLGWNLRMQQCFSTGSHMVIVPSHLTSCDAKRFPATRQLAFFLNSTGNHGNLSFNCWRNKSWSHESLKSQRPSSPSERRMERFRILPTYLKCFGSVDTETQDFLFPSHTYATYTGCTLCVWIESSRNYLPNM